MRKVNFHTLDNLTVPPALIEKALAIPASSENTPAILPWYKRTRLIAAASIVLVVLAGISVFFIFGNNKIPVKPSGTSDVPIAADTTTSDGTPSADPTGSGAVEPHSERPTGTAAQSETIDASSAPQPTIITPRGIVTATLSPSNPPNVTPATESNNGLADRPDVPAPTSSAPPATEQQPAPTEKPTQLPYEPETDPPEDPYTPPSDGAGESPGAPAGAVIYSEVNSSLLTGNRHVFCVLYNRAGKRVDTEPILSPKHETFTTTRSDGLAYFAYIPPKDWNLSTGMYEMEIYNENGAMIKRTIVFWDNE